MGAEWTAITLLSGLWEVWACQQTTHLLCLPPSWKAHLQDRPGEKCLKLSGSSAHLGVCVCVLSHFSYVWFSGAPWTIAHQTPLSMAFSRQEYWSGLPFPSPGDLPDPGIEPTSPALQADSLLSEPCKSQLSFSRNILLVFLCILFMSVVARRFQSLTLSETDQVSKFWHPPGKQLLWSLLISFNHNFLMGLKNPDFKEKCPPLSAQCVPCDPSENHCLWFCYLSFPSFLSLLMLNLLWMRVCLLLVAFSLQLFFSLKLIHVFYNTLLWFFAHCIKTHLTTVSWNRLPNFSGKYSPQQKPLLHHPQGWPHSLDTGFSPGRSVPWESISHPRSAPL